ncbi:MAG: flavodoxin family protein [Halanaerobiales bacterium]
MDVYVLNGLSDRDTEYNVILQKLIRALSNDANVEVANLKEKEIDPCLGCFGCWVKTPGICVIDDYGREAARKAINSDLLIYLSPVRFGGFSSTLKRAVDRMIPNILPYFRKVNGEIHHKQRYKNRHDIIGIGLLDTANNEDEEIFSQMIKRIGINMGVKNNSFFLYKNVSDERLDEDIEKICRMVK